METDQTQNYIYSTLDDDVNNNYVYQPIGMEHINVHKEVHSFLVRKVGARQRREEEGISLVA